MPFISSCLISLARTSGAVSNRGGESGRSYLVPDLSGEVSIFTTKYDVSYGTPCFYFCMFLPFSYLES